MEKKKKNTFVKAISHKGLLQKTYKEFFKHNNKKMNNQFKMTQICYQTFHQTSYADRKQACEKMFHVTLGNCKLKQQ